MCLVFLLPRFRFYFSALVQPTYKGVSLDSVSVFWYGVDPLANPDTIKLNDSGYDGDIIVQDDVFTRKIFNAESVLTNFIPDSDTGLVFLKFVADYHQNIYTDSISIYLQNIVPQVLSVTAPDTIVRPIGDETKIIYLLISVEVYDANGLDDINIVGFTSLHVGPDTLLNNGNLIELYDDGSEIDFCPDFSDYQCTSGDILKNDGTFSREVPIFGIDSIDPEDQTKTGNFIWSFEVEDFVGDKSEPWVHQVHVK